MYQTGYENETALFLVFLMSKNEDYFLRNRVTNKINFSKKKYYEKLFDDLGNNI